MITQVRLQDFKALADATFPLERLTVLVGANGAGKSTALQGIAWAAQMSHSFATAERASGSLERDRWIRRGRPALRAWIESRTQGYKVEACFTRNAQGDDPPMQAAWTDPSGQARAKNNLAFDKKILETLNNEVPLFHGLAIRHLQLSVPKLREASAARSATPQLDDDGGGLAATLAYLLKADRDAFDALEADLRRVVPQVRRVVLEQAQVPNSSFFGDIVGVDIHDVGRILAPDLSEGTLLSLALLTELHRPAAPDLLLLDDIDRGLHPRAQADLIGCLQRLLEQRPTLQIVATSHSPYLLDHLEPSQVIVMALDERSVAHASLLSDHPEWQRMKGLLKTGEFWSSVGEEWVLPGAPDAA